jgi:ubiquitin-conjugating enzyme E2 W
MPHSQIHEHLPPGIALASANDLKEWLMDIRVLDDNPIYKNETYRLRFKFSSNYPIGMPSAIL